MLQLLIIEDKGNYKYSEVYDKVISDFIKGKEILND